MRLFSIASVLVLLGAFGAASAQPGPCSEPVLINHNENWAPLCVEFCEESNGVRTLCLGPVPSYCPTSYPEVGYLFFHSGGGGWCDDCTVQEAYLVQVGSGYWHVIDGLTYLCADYMAYSYTSPPFTACVGWDPPLSQWGSWDCILPAELAAFSAVSVAEGIEISFATSSETELNYFEIAREHDGVTSVAAQLPASNSATGSEYSYLDRNVVAGESYRYYLRTVDLDGSIEEHLDHAVTVTYSPNAVLPTELALRAYPNPFNPATQLSYSVPQAGEVELTVFDATGREVITLFKGTVGAGEHRAEFDGTTFSSGTYFAQLRTATQTKMTRLALVK